MYLIIKQHQTNTEQIAILPWIRVERRFFWYSTVGNAKNLITGEWWKKKKIACKLRTCCGSIWCPSFASTPNHYQGDNWTLKLHPENSSYLGIKARILVGIADVHGEACGSYELSNTVIYEPVGIWWFLHAFFETIKTKAGSQKIKKGKFPWKQIS